MLTGSLTQFDRVIYSFHSEDIAVKWVPTLKDQLGRTQVMIGTAEVDVNDDCLATRAAPQAADGEAFSEDETPR